MQRFRSSFILCVVLGLCIWGWWKSNYPSEKAPAAEATPTLQGKSIASSDEAPGDEITPEKVDGANDAADFLQTIPAGELKRGLQALPPELRIETLIKLRELHVPANDLVNLRVDLHGQFFYVCDVPDSLPVGSEMAGETPRTPASIEAASVPVTAPPIRHSRPGATRVAYLDFNGHTVTGTSWNSTYGVTTFVCKPYDTDGNTTTFSDAEQAAIIRIWARVAEDFASFDIDVTTEEPATFTTTTARILITSSTDANGQSNPEGGRSGGVAYVGVYGKSYYPTTSPAFVYHNSLLNDANVAEAASHEFGHNLGLSHDGTNTLSYYGGHGSGETSWGPIMGTGYNRNVSQWSKGEYYNANNTQDDLMVIAASLPFLSDDIVDSPAGAQTLLVSGSSVSGAGIIERSTDADRFSFQTAGGSVTLLATPFKSTSGTAGGNLDIKLELYNSSNTVVATADPSATTAATITTNIAAGVYTLRVLPTGTGNPLANPSSGYTLYGSVGAYTITGTVAPSTDPIAPVITANPLDQTVITGGNAVFSVTATGSAPLSYLWKKGSAELSGQTANSLSLIGVQSSAAGSYTVTVSNSAGSVVSAAAVLTVAPAPIAPSITTQPASQSAVTGSSVTFTVAANGTAPLAYQWRRNGVSITGATVASLTLPGVTLNDAGGYSVMVSNSVGAVTSAAAVLSVSTLPVFTLHPVSRSVVPGESTTFTAATSGLPAPTLQWQRSTDNGQTWSNLTNAGTVSGVTTGTLSLTALTVGSSGDRFRCVATNTVGAVSSDPATLTVAVLPPVTAIATSTYHTLYLKADGTVWATGDNSSGQFGNGSYTAYATPVQVADQAAAIAVGYGHSLVLKANGTLWSAGSNNYGQLGDGTTTSRAAFVQIATGVSAIAARAYNSAFIRQDGTLWVMGDNQFGQLGDGTLIQRNAPVTVASSVKAVALGYTHLLNLQTDGTLKAAGENTAGQLGDGSTTNRLNAVTVETNVATITAGYRISAFLKADGTLWATGLNDQSQFGNGTPTSHTTPGQFATGRTRVSVNFNHLLAINATADLLGSGNNLFNQLTTSTALGLPTPGTVAQNVATAEAGYYTSHWVKTDGSTWAVGKNISGQLGDGSTTDRRVPVQIFSGVPAVAATPGGLQASDGSSATLVRLTWTQLSGGMQYEVWRHTINNSAAATRIAFSETVNFFEDRAATPGTTYYYWVRAVGPGGTGAFTAPDTGYRVSSGTAPSFVTQPVNVTVLTGGTTTFTVATSGDPTPTLQWQISTDAGANWSNLSTSGIYQGTSTATLTLTNVPSNYTGYRYRCVATNTVSTATSTSATLTVNAAPQAPTIINHPASVSVTENSPATFSVTATGTAPLSYQWRRNSTDIPTATNSTYTIASAQFANAGTYDVVVTNTVSTATSNPVILTVNAPELFTPARKTVSAIAQFYPLNIKTSGPWTISESLSWLSVSPSSGSGNAFAYVFVQENTGTTARSGTILVNGLSHTVTQQPDSSLDHWQWRNPPTSGTNQRKVIWNGTQYVAVGESGSIQTSADGLNWTGQSSGTPQHLFGAAWGNNLLVVAGAAGTIRTSPDGTNWTARVAGTSTTLYAVAWNGSLFAAVGSAGEIRTSPDGITWTARTSGTANELRNIAAQAGQFVAVGASGTILTSADGITWTARTSGTTALLISVNSNGSQWIVGGLFSIYTSPDAINWTSRTLGASAAVYTVLWDGSAWLAAGSSGYIFTSPDGVAWTTVSSGTTNDLYSLAWNGQRLVVTGRAGAILTSTDRQTWSLANTITTQWLYDVSWNGSQFVALGNDGTILTSPDGTTWSKQNSGTTKNFFSITWSGAQFVASGEAGTLLTSPDGITWTARTSGSTRNLWRTLWNGSQFLAVGEGTSVYTSPDGITWTARALGASTTLFDVAWNGQLYAAVGNAGVIFTSPDALTWTERASPAAGIGSLQGVVWNGSVFITVGDNGVAASSPDGMTWTKVEIQQGIALKAITWNGTNFIAVGSAGYCASSADGTNWVVRQTLPTETLAGLAWAGDKFVAVGWYGAIISTTDSSLRSAPDIIAQPQSQTAAKSSTVSFRVIATGSPAPTYQWRKQTTPLSGATAATLTLTNVDAPDATAYDVVVTNSAGSVTSYSASLTILSGYTAWQLGYFSASEQADVNISGPASDPDEDGLSNLLEYALGLNPKSTDTSALPEMSTTATNWVYTYTRPTDRADITYVVEVSTDLSSWSTSGVTLTKVSTSSNVEIWQATYPLSSATNAFFRLKITQ